MDRREAGEMGGREREVGRKRKGMRRGKGKQERDKDRGRKRDKGGTAHLSTQIQWLYATAMQFPCPTSCNTWREKSVHTLATH